MNNALLIVFGLQVVLAIIASSFNSKWIINNSTDHSSDQNCKASSHNGESDLIPSYCQNAYYLGYTGIGEPVNKL